MKIKRFKMDYINSNMYILIENEQGLIIDPNISLEAFEYLIRNDVKEIVIVLTHSHFDHTSGVNFFSNEFKSKIICHEKCSEFISNKKNNRPLLMCLLLSNKDKEDGGNRLKTFLNKFEKYEIISDITFKNQLEFIWGSSLIHLIHAPGHSLGSIFIFINNLVFTGDYLINLGEKKTIKVMEDIYKLKKNKYLILSKINEYSIIFPGHGNPYLYSRIDNFNINEE